MPQPSQQTAPLFPILPQRLTGLPRMAAEAEHVDDGHLVEFRSLAVKSVLNRSISRRQLWLAYSINPYRGCEFGCRYCYARYTHEVLSPDPQPVGPQADLPRAEAGFRDPEAFERIIFLKQNAAGLLEQDLKRIDPEQQIALGTATDPYQPIERRARITRSLLEVFARRTGYRLGIVTKSTLIERDLDLLGEIDRRNRLVVHITITTPDADLARKLEPRAPRPELRFRTVRRLGEAGIKVGILCCPLLPGITDSEQALDEMAQRAAQAKASFLAANPLFLKPCSRPTYFEFIRRHFPALMKDYQSRYGSRDFAAPSYRREMARILERACRRHGLGERFADALQPHEPGDSGAAEPGRTPPRSVTLDKQRKLFA